MITTQYLIQSIEQGNDVAALGWLASAHDQGKILPLDVLALAVKLGRSVVVVEWSRLAPHQVMELPLLDLVAAPSAEVVFGLLQAPIDIDQQVSLHGHPIPLGMAWGLKFPILSSALEQRRLGEQAKAAAQMRYDAIVAQMASLQATPPSSFPTAVVAPVVAEPPILVNTPPHRVVPSSTVSGAEQGLPPLFPEIDLHDAFISDMQKR